jgi:UDPglucose--hexose-1-phosphate uridylyltransferase
MIELRKDYILDRWSYIAADRGKRPKQFKKSEKNSNERVCYFCPGSEHLTPPEIGRVEYKNGWKIRWFLNKFPAVSEDSKSGITMSNSYYSGGGAFGYHEIIVETPDHNKQLADLSVNEIKKVLEVYSLRIRELSKKEGIKYVQVFKNSGAEAGTSLIHTHTQIVATSIIPGLVEKEIKAVKEYRECPYCDIVKQEENSGRFIYSNDNFICFAPYAPRFNYEVWIFPKKHKGTIVGLNSKELEDLSRSFKKVLSKLGKMNVPYNFYLHCSPKGEDLHFHFEIAPRMNKWAGFELATDSYVITTSPEDAAEFFRENIEKI